MNFCGELRADELIGIILLEVENRKAGFFRKLNDGGDLVYVRFL